MKQLRMNQARMISAVIAGAWSIAAAGSVSAQAPHRLTPQQRAASHQIMQQGLTDLQQASSALESGNGGQARQEIQTAISTMVRAQPIYRGYLQTAVREAGKALKALPKDGKETPAVAMRLGTAIRAAQSAVSMN